MKHQIGKKKLNRKPAHRRALIRNQAIHLINNDCLQTTKARVKVVQQFVEKLVTIARKGGDFNTIRRVKQLIPYDDKAVTKMIKEIEVNEHEREYDAVEIKWYELGSRANTRLYTADLPFDSVGAYAGYAILPGTYWPVEANVIDDLTGNLQIVSGYFQGELLSSALIVFYNNQAIYHHSASKQQKAPVNYLLQWEVIKIAKNKGKSIYNLWGVAPEDNKNHPWAGLSLFKKGFGGYQKNYVVTQDLPLSFSYYLTYIIERLRKLKRRL